MIDIVFSRLFHIEAILHMLKAIFRSDKVEVSKKTYRESL